MEKNKALKAAGLAIICFGIVQMIVALAFLSTPIWTNRANPNTNTYAFSISTPGRYTLEASKLFDKYGQPASRGTVTFTHNQTGTNYSLTYNLYSESSSVEGVYADSAAFLQAGDYRVTNIGDRVNYEVRMTGWLTLMPEINRAADMLWGGLMLAIFLVIGYVLIKRSKSETT